MNSGQREEMWNSPQHAKAMVALDLKNGLGDTPRKEEGRKFVAVPVWVLWLTGAIILGLVMAVMSLSVVALHNRQTLINWENNDDYPAEKVSIITKCYNIENILYSKYYTYNLFESETANRKP